MKKFCDKLIVLRREKGLSQEQLAEYLEVSRQSVSKWEADKTMPEISKLIAISGLFQVSLDYLLIDDCENRNGRFPGVEDVPDYGAGKGLGGSDIKRQQDSGQWEMDAGWPETSSRETEEMKKSLNEIKEFIGCREGFEYKSKASVFGLPLVHVKFGGGNGKVRLRDAAWGIIAVGNLAFGVVSVGIFFSWRTQFWCTVSGTAFFPGGYFPGSDDSWSGCDGNCDRRYFQCGDLCHRSCGGGEGGCHRSVGKRKDGGRHAGRQDKWMEYDRDGQSHIKGSHEGFYPNLQSGASRMARKFSYPDL